MLDRRTFLRLSGAAAATPLLARSQDPAASPRSTLVFDAMGEVRHVYTPELLREMLNKTDTRFLIITHHPYTMSQMNRLFGVTMAERGVSQLVSVDLETAESYREAS